MNLGPDGSLRKITCSLKQTNNIAIISLSDKLKSSLVPFYKLVSVGAEESHESDESESSGDDIKTDAAKPANTIGKNSADIAKKPASDDEKNKSSQNTRNSTDSQCNTHKTQKHTGNRPPKFLPGNRSYSSNNPSSRSYQNEFQRYPGGRRSFNNLDRHPRNNFSARNIPPWQHQIPDGLLINNVPNPINLIENSQMVPHNAPQIVPPVVMNSSCDNVPQGLLGDYPFEQNHMHSIINLGSAVDQQYGVNHQTYGDGFLNDDQNYYEGPIQSQYWPESDYADNYQGLAPGRPLDHPDFQNLGPPHRSFNPNGFERPPNRPFNISSVYQRTDIDGPIKHFNNFQGSGPERVIDPYNCPNPNLDAPSNHSNVQRPKHSNVRRPQQYQSHRPRRNDQLNNCMKPDSDVSAAATSSGFNYKRLGEGTYNLKQNNPSKGFHTKTYRNKYAWRTGEKRKTTKETGPGHFSYDY